MKNDIKLSAKHLIIIGLFFAHISFAQNLVKKDYHFDGDVSITNNGFSFIPTFSLGKPATIVDLSIGGKRFSFDPQFRFDLDGLKPWSFIFIWRYKLIKNEKWTVRPGVHLPAISFREQIVDINGVTQDQIFTQRWFTPELTASYNLSDNISIGTYYIHGFGLEKEGQTKNTNFISLRVGFSNIRLIKKLYMKWNPQIYYLTMDDLGGFFASQSITLAYREFPISMSSMMNKSLGSDNEIPAEDFTWNVSLIYSFKNNFSKK